MIRVVILAAALATAIPVRAQEPAAAAPESTAPPGIEAGRRAYTATCARCHGINLVVTSSAFFDLRTFPKEEKERFLNSVTNGKRQMPAWGGMVKPETMESIWLYIGSVNGW
jgi:mono/diheme cytochrome c family protein